MKADERRKSIVAILTREKGPVAGAVLAETMGVSRQIVVQDISVLRAAGYDILSTHTGYIIRSSPLAERVFKTYHDSSQTADELQTIVDLGGTVVDVFVWHKAYGKIEAPLNIFSRHGIEQFMQSLKSGKSSELMHVTSGYHYHTVRAHSEQVLDTIEQTLGAKNYLVSEL